MSGIYIPGISMPEDGWHKAINIFSDGTVVSYYYRTELGKDIPVPDHNGPLVDALEVINTFPEDFVFTNEQAKALTNYIIPADKEDKE